MSRQSRIAAGIIRMGDLLVVDRDGLGMDIHRTADKEKLTFFTQGGELGLLEHLQEKYPEAQNVARGLQHEYAKSDR